MNNIAPPSLEQCKTLFAAFWDLLQEHGVIYLESRPNNDLRAIEMICLFNDGTLRIYVIDPETIWLCVREPEHIIDWVNKALSTPTDDLHYSFISWRDR